MYCSAFGCSNKTGTESIDRGIRFHCFPKDPGKHLEWATKVRRIDMKTGGLWMPSKSSVLCSEHFLPGDFTPQHDDCGSKQLKPDVVPSIFACETRRDKCLLSVAFDTYSTCLDKSKQKAVTTKPPIAEAIEGLPFNTICEYTNDDNVILRAKLTSAVDAMMWLRAYEKLTNTLWNLERTFSNVKSLLVNKHYICCLPPGAVAKCEMNQLPYLMVKSRNCLCTVKMKLKISLPERVGRGDKFLKAGYRGFIKIFCDNHSTKCMTVYKSSPQTFTSTLPDKSTTCQTFAPPDTQTLPSPSAMISFLNSAQLSKAEFLSSLPSKTDPLFQQPSNLNLDISLPSVDSLRAKFEEYFFTGLGATESFGYYTDKLQSMDHAWNSDSKVGLLIPTLQTVASWYDSWLKANLSKDKSDDDEEPATDSDTFELQQDSCSSIVKPVKVEKVSDIKQIDDDDNNTDELLESLLTNIRQRHCRFGRDVSGIHAMLRRVEKIRTSAQWRTFLSLFEMENPLPGDGILTRKLLQGRGSLKNIGLDQTRKRSVKRNQIERRQNTTATPPVKHRQNKTNVRRGKKTESSRCQKSKEIMSPKSKKRKVQTIFACHK